MGHRFGVAQPNLSKTEQTSNVCIVGKKFLILILSRAHGPKRYLTNAELLLILSVESCRANASC
jgi:hypothetical protein